MQRLCSYQDTIQYLYNLKRHGIRLGLETIARLAHRLGNPQDRFPSILIGGTNGKGSVSAMIANILKTAGYRTGLYTSPHLQRFTERIRINDEEILEDKVIELVKRIKTEIQGSRSKTQTIPHNLSTLLPTFFEFVTAMAFTYFADEGIDFGVFEVGMGGRLDATNILTPLVSVITNVSKEHTEFLGEDIREIAGEKGGIIKEGGLVITGADGEALEVLRDICSKRDARILALNEDFDVVTGDGGRFDYKGSLSLKGLESGLMGRHQISNAALAISAIEALIDYGVDIDESAIRQGLKTVKWHGRLELMDLKARHILLDCAHNPAGAGVLKEFLERGDISFKRLILIIGILRDKEIDRILETLVPLSDIVIPVQPDEERAAPVDLLMERAKRYIHSPDSINAIRDVAEAVEFGLKTAEPNDLVCITGSIFTVGEARKAMEGLISSL